MYVWSVNCDKNGGRACIDEQLSSQISSLCEMHMQVFFEKAQFFKLSVNVKYYSRGKGKPIGRGLP